MTDEPTPALPEPQQSDRRLLVAVVAILIVGAVAIGVYWWARDQAPGPTAEPEVVTEEPCPDSEFTCVTLRVPR